MPVLFRKYPGIATGFIGGVSTTGGIIYPIVFGKVENIHDGYGAVSLFFFLPFILFFIFAFGRFRTHITGDEGLGSKESWGIVEEGEAVPSVHGDVEVAVIAGGGEGADISMVEMRKKERWLVAGMLVLWAEAATAVLQTVYSLFMALTGRGGIGGH